MLPWFSADKVFNMKRAIMLVLGILECLEMFVRPCLLVAFGPFLWMFWLARSHRVVPTITVGLFWLASVGLIACEVRRKAFTGVSLFIVLVWLVVLAFVFSFHFG